LTGLQDLMIKQNIKVSQLAKEVNMPPGRMWDWFKVNRIPKQYLKVFAEKFNVEEEYIGKQVNDISTYRPKQEGINEYKIIGDITEIYLHHRNGDRKICIIDTEELNKLLELNITWSPCLNHPNRKGADSYYAIANIDGEDGKKTTITMQTFILGTRTGDHKNKITIDHENQNTLDNRKENLRIISNTNNSKYRKSKNTNNKSGFRNVFWNTKDERWMVALQVDGKQHIFGRFKFDDLDKAGKLAEEMRQLYYKEFAGYD